MLSWPRIAGVFVLLIGMQTQDAVAVPPVEAFARLPTFTDLEISPGGRYLFARVNVGNQYIAGAYDISGPGMKPVHGFREIDGLSVDWFRWVSERHLLVSVAFSAKRPSGQVRRIQTEERRLLSLDAATGTLTALFSARRGEMPVQIQDRVVSFLPNDPEHVLVQYSRSDPSQPLVYKVPVTELGRHKRIQGGRLGILRWMTDASGDVRLGSGVKRGDKASLIVREVGAKKWTDLSHRVSTDSVVFDPAGFTAEPNQIYVISNHEGDPSGLYTFDISTDSFGPLIFKHDSVDIRSVRIDESTAELMSVNFVNEELKTKRFRERPIASDIARFHEQYPGTSLTTASVSSDGNYAVVRLRGTGDAGRYYLFDGNAQSARQMPSQYVELDGFEPGRAFPVNYTARDGLEISGFVTLPPGVKSLEEASDLPFVVHPHGGPGAQDFLRFDFTVQFLASRGYGVLQMNFRGSTGYGREFQVAGSRQWGQAMQDDLTDGVNWLVNNGYAAADRVAILGGSYGGYAALMGAVKTPDLYQCAISFAGVSDLPDLISREKKYIAGAYRTRFVGDLWRDRKMLAENSPARRVDDIRIPVLLMHGDQDTVVEIDQSEKMAKQLRRNGKDVDFVVFEDGDHFLSLYKNRLRYLVEVEGFLGDCLETRPANIE